MNSSRRVIPILSETIPPQLSEVNHLCLRLRGVLESEGLCHLRFAIELLARECLNNAVLHGSEHNPDKPVSLQLSINHGWVRLQVRDEGPGFDWHNLVSREMDTRASSGRGLSLYSIYAERVRFNRRGNQITLWIKNRGNEKGDAVAAYVIDRKEIEGSVKLAGDLTAVQVPQLRSDLNQVLNQGVRDLVFDLEHTVMLDSSGIGLLIAASNTVSQKGGNIQIRNTSREIFHLLQTMRLTDRLNVSRGQETGE